MINAITGLLLVIAKATSVRVSPLLKLGGLVEILLWLAVVTSAVFIPAY